jgi:hypothetical protein
MKGDIMKRYALTIPVLLAVMFLSTAGNESQKQIREAIDMFRHSTTVQLRIGGDKEITNDVYSYVSRELRSLGDVEVVKDNAEWIFDINAHRIQAKWVKDWLLDIKLSEEITARQTKESFERPFGFSLSSVLLKTSRLSSDTLKYIFEGRINEKDCKYIIKLYDDACWFQDHVAGSGPDLQSLCQSLIASFDAVYLKPERERNQEIINEFRKQLQKKKEEEKKGLTLREMVEKKKAESKQK